MSISWACTLLRLDFNTPLLSEWAENCELCIDSLERFTNPLKWSNLDFLNTCFGDLWFLFKKIKASPNFWPLKTFEAWLDSLSSFFLWLGEKRYLFIHILLVWIHLILYHLWTFVGAFSIFLITYVNHNIFTW